MSVKSWFKEMFVQRGLFDEETFVSSLVPPAPAREIQRRKDLEWAEDCIRRVHGKVSDLTDEAFYALVDIVVEECSRRNPPKAKVKTRRKTKRSCQ